MTKKTYTICHRRVKVTQRLPVADLRRVRQPRRAETAVAAAATAAIPPAAVEAAAAVAVQVARCDTLHRIRRRSRRRRPRATPAGAAATGTVVVATGDNTREESG